MMEDNKSKSEIEQLTESEGDRMIASVQGIIPPIYSESQAKEMFENIQKQSDDDTQR